MRPLSAEPRYPARVRAPRRDPAPSRLAFRMQRLWLTPVVRMSTRIGLPIFGVVLGLGLWLGDEGRRADLFQWGDDIRLEVQNRPEFRLSTLKIEGASPEVEDAIGMMLPVALPASRFAIDLKSFHDAIARLDAVKDVSLIVRADVLDIKVTEREPVMLWRTDNGIEMLDEAGHRTASLTRRDARPDLPLIAGEGADNAVPEALEVMAAARPILPRMRGLVRMGERRWDIVLDGDRRIMLPERNPVRAVERILALDAAEDLLSRDFTRVDLREGDRPTVRLSGYSLEQFQIITGQIPAPRPGTKANDSKTGDKKTTNARANP